LRDILAEQVAKSTELQEDYKHFKRYESTPNHQDYTYEFLHTAVERQIANKRLEKNRKNQIKGFKKGAFDDGSKDDKKNKDNQQAGLQDNKRPTPKPRAKSSPAPKRRDGGDGGGKGTRDQRPKATPKPQPAAKKKAGGQGNGPCWLFQTAHNGGKTCKYGDECRFDHVNVKKSEFDKIRPPREFSPAPSPKKQGGGGKGGGANPEPKPKAKAKPKPKAEAGIVQVRHCFDWKKNGSCSRGDDCNFPHLTKEEVKAEMDRLKKAKNA